jgi:hypothetical protein
VADALQQQLNVLGLVSPRLSARAAAGPACGGDSSGGCGPAAAEGLQKQGSAAGGALTTALAAARAAGAAAVAGTSGTIDGSGRLLGTVAGAAGLLLPVGGPDRGDQLQLSHYQAAERGQLGGALSASGVTYSLRLQSAGAQQHTSKAAAVAGVARTSSVGALPVCLGSMPAGSSSAGGCSEGSSLPQQRQAPTAEGLRALLKGSSANSSSSSSSSSSSRGGTAAAGSSGQLPPTAGRVGSGGSRGSGSAQGDVKLQGEQETVFAGVGRASPLALMKQQSGTRGGVSSSSARITSA